MTRSLSTSLALTMLLATGTAMAAPASQDNFAQRVGKSLTASTHYFASDLKARNEKAGPGFFKRTMTKLGASVDRMHDKATALGEKISTKIENAGAKLDAKREQVAASIHNGLHKTGERIQLAAANTKAFGNKLAYATKQGIAATRSSMAQSRAERIAYKAADKDFNAWLDEKGNEDAKTFYRGASKDAGVGMMKFTRGVTRATTAVGLAASVVNPIFLAPSALNIGMGRSIDNNVKLAKRDAAERTINTFMDKVPASRLESWSKASYIDPELAK